MMAAITSILISAGRVTIRGNGMKTTRIVIAGGGFAGLYAAMHFDKRLARRADVEVTLISRENFILFTPMLHEVAAGDLYPGDIVNPLRRISTPARSSVEHTSTPCSRPGACSTSEVHSTGTNRCGSMPGTISASTIAASATPARAAPLPAAHLPRHDRSLRGDHEHAGGTHHDVVDVDPSIVGPVQAVQHPPPADGRAASARVLTEIPDMLPPCSDVLGRGAPPTQQAGACPALEPMAGARLASRRADSVGIPGRVQVSRSNIWSTSAGSHTFVARSAGRPGWPSYTPGRRVPIPTPAPRGRSTARVRRAAAPGRPPPRPAPTRSRTRRATVAPRLLPSCVRTCECTSRCPDQSRESMTKTPARPTTMWSRFATRRAGQRTSYIARHAPAGRPSRAREVASSWPAVSPAMSPPCPRRERS